MDGVRLSAAAEPGFTMDDVNEEEEDALAAIKSSKRMSGRSPEDAVPSQNANAAPGSSLIGEAYGEAVLSEDDTQSDLRSDPGDNLYTESSCTPATELECSSLLPGFASHSGPCTFTGGAAIESDIASSETTVISMHGNHHQTQTVPYQPFPTVSSIENDNFLSEPAIEQPLAVTASWYGNRSVPAGTELGLTIADDDAATRRTSVDDRPSLMSSPSTMTSDTYRDGLSTSQPRITAVSEARSGTSTPSVSSSSRGRFRRSSILSLSRLMANGVQERSASPTKQSRRPQASEAKRRPKDGQGRRFNRIFNFLKSN